VRSPGGAGGRWLTSLPGVRTILGYQPGWLGSDVGAGLVLTALLVPRAWRTPSSRAACGEGLYTTVLALAAYAVFGPSRVLVLGPDSALAPLIAAAVVPLAAGDPVQAVSLAAALALLTGAVCVGTGLARLGTITELLSKPVRVGYINGIAMRRRARLHPQGADTAEVLRTVRAVGEGEALFGPAIARRLTSFFRHAEGSGMKVSPFPQLTDREREVLDLIAEGLDNQRIASRLFISGKTVSNHISNIFAKLHVVDRAPAIVTAREAGFDRGMGHP